MTNHVFIIPEPHLWDKTFRNRKDYPKEVTGYIAEVVEKIKAYDGSKTIIFPGDIFHRGYAGIDGLISAFNLFKELNALTDGNVYSCVGNHELSYMTNNPFWILADDYTDRFINLHGIKAFGAMQPGIKVVDELTIGKLQFIFGHFNRDDYTVDTDIDTVLITHNSIVEPEIEEYMSTRFERQSTTEYMHTFSLKQGQRIPISENLKYIFVGHMHTFFGKFNVDEVIANTSMQFTMQYMGSLGRTSISEISDNDLIRVIPHFAITETGYAYEPFELSLQPRSDIVIEQVVLDNSKKYENVKAMRQLVENSSFGETPEQRIDRRLAESPFLLELFHAVYSNELNSTLTTLLKEAESYE